MSTFDAAGFLVSLLSMSASVSLLLGGLALGKEKLLTRYRVRTLYQLGLLLTALLLCPWRPALLLPKITLPAAPVQEAAIWSAEASLPSTPEAEASGKVDDLAATGATDTTGATAGGTLDLAAEEASGDVNRQAGMAQTAQEPAPSPAWILFAVWLAGALVVLLFQTIRHMRFLRLVRRWRSPLPQEIQAALAEQGARLGIKPPSAYTAPCVESPTVVGLLRPMLLLPAIQYDPGQLGLMLAHELIHYKHGHLWGKALGCLALAVHWFNPLMPFLLREMGWICEMACDEAVLTREEPERRSAYVDAILNAALLTRTARSPLCSPLNGGVNQMNQIKQRIALMTPFRPRRTGAGFIACTLLLALLTGSVLAVGTSGFSIPESEWLTPASGYMSQADYDLVMSMQTPGWEELSTEEFAERLTPQMPKLKLIFDWGNPENRFMRHLRYSVAEARVPVSDKYQTPWNTGFWREDEDGAVMFSCELNWSYLEDETLTCAKRDRLLDAALARAASEVRALTPTEIEGAPSLRDASAAFGARLNGIAKELGEGSLSIWFTGVNLDTSRIEESGISQEQRELISLLTPEGYRDQTVAEYRVFLAKYQDRFDDVALQPVQSDAYQIVTEAYQELRGYYTFSGCSAMVDLALLPAWTMRGDMWYEYQLEWKTADPDHMTVGQRHDAIRAMFTRITDEAAGIAWEASDWEALDKALKERLPIIAQEESTPALTFTVSEVGLKLQPLATEEYVHSAPLHVMNAFMTYRYNQDIAQMAAVCVPIETGAGKAEASAARKELIKSLAKTLPYGWTYGEPRKEPDTDDGVIVDVTYYSDLGKGTGMPVKESRQARLRQIDGKWYLLPESLQP